MSLKKSVERFQEDLEAAFSARRFVVFLCGPSLKHVDSDPAAALRAKIMDHLKADGFEVVLGEDDGLESLREKFGGMAHENELQFIQKQSNAVIVVANSVGSFCELGLFSHQHVRNNSSGTDFILILDEHYKECKSYLNEGPAKAIDNFGKLFHANYPSFDIDQILDRLRTHRSVWFTR